MLQLTNLNKSFHREEKLTNINYIFNKGELYPILGRHSSGKTLLLECIGNLCRPDGGRVYVTDGSGSMMLTDEAKFPPYLTLMEYMNVLCGHDEAVGALDRVGVYEEDYSVLLRDCEPEVRKRLQFATLLVRKPYVILIDSPFDFCSEEFFEDMMGLLEELKEEHVILVTTGSVDVARSISRDIVVLNNGELNQISDESFRIPEIRQAVIELVSEGDDEIY